MYSHNSVVNMLVHVCVHRVFVHLYVSTGVYHLTEDGARLGQPAKEYLHVTLLFPGGQAAYLPPQELGLGRRGNGHTLIAFWSDAIVCTIVWGRVVGRVAGRRIFNFSRVQ